jgi:hypothetical protein
MNTRRSRIVLAGFAILISASHACALDRRVIGAWSTSVGDCASTFQRKGATWVYRPPMDQFKSTFIISDKQVFGPGGHCAIAKASQSADTITMNLNCQNSIGYLPRSVRIKITGENQISYGFPDNDDLDVSYTKCP